MWRRLCGVALVLGAVQCASTRPAGQAIPVISDPPGATASSDRQSIATPGTLYAPEGAREMEIRIEKQGFETAFVLLTSESGSLKDCVDKATMSPGKPTGGTTDSGSPGLAIAVAATKALANCSAATAERLEPSMVFVKLVPLPEPPAPK